MIVLSTPNHWNASYRPIKLKSQQQTLAWNLQKPNVPVRSAVVILRDRFSNCMLGNKRCYTLGCTSLSLRMWPTTKLLLIWCSNHVNKRTVLEELYESNSCKCASQFACVDFTGNQSVCIHLPLMSKQLTAFYQKWMARFSKGMFHMWTFLHFGYNHCALACQKTQDFLPSK